MAIVIITDSASDIEQGEYAGVKVMPITVTIDEVSYRDGVDLTKDTFYELLEAGDTMPVTSLISPYQFEEVYAEIEAAGDEAIVIPISSGLSGTCQSAQIAAASHEKISVVDSMQVSGSQKILVMRALELVGQGLSREEVVAQLEADRNRIAIFAVTDTLEYLVRGGRLSKTAGMVGSLIDIKPILTIKEGKLISIGKSRGMKKSHIMLNKLVEEAGGIDFTMPYLVGYSGSSRKNIDDYVEHNKALLEGAPHMPEVFQIGSTVGTHAGPGAVLVTFFTKAAE